VIIISHSMGGLVTRRYAQLFGDDALAGVVFIGSPQKGISTRIGRYCRILGHNQECRDMEEGSLLLNKLDQDLIGVPSLNVIGIGCSMNGGDGDGVVLTSNAKLVGSKELEVRGTCTGTTLLHNSLLNIAKYPVVYSAITNFLDGINSTLLK
jgi:hypothetical protein